MGCHTYIYKKVKEIPTEEFKSDVLNAIAQIEASGKYSDKERKKLLMILSTLTDVSLHMLISFIAK